VVRRGARSRGKATPLISPTVAVAIEALPRTLDPQCKLIPILRCVVPDCYCLSALFRDHPFGDRGKDVASIRFGIGTANVVEIGATATRATPGRITIGNIASGDLDETVSRQFTDVPTHHAMNDRDQSITA
jgi:hypothetical protein